MLTLVQPQRELDIQATDRRSYGRLYPRVQADAMRLDHTIPARRQPKLRLHVRDVSAGGLSAISEQPVMAGEQIAVNFPMRIGLPMGSMYGHVVRCEPRGSGYRVAVEFDPLPAA